MKRFFLFLMLLSSIWAHSQITLDFQSTLPNLWPVKITDTETKYYELDQTTLNTNNQFSIYNLDGTLYKTIDMPPKPDPNAFSFYVEHLSRTLFDNDPSTIEYLIQYEWDSIPSLRTTYEVKVIREDGTILLDEPYGLSNYIYSTEEGTKLMINNYHYSNGAPLPYSTKVFNLPGQIPTSAENKNSISGSSPVLFPNPNNGSFYINFSSEHKEDITIELYTSSGKLLNTYISGAGPTHINNQNLPDGMYFLKATNNNHSQRVKFIIQK